MTKIALAIAGLVASTAAFAAPVTIAQIEAARVAGTLQQAWISGASAPTISVYEGWVGSGAGVGCDPTTNAIFTSQNNTGANAGLVKPGSIGNFTAYACTRGGRVSVLYHTLDGGSLNAYAPHTVGTRLARLAYLGQTTCSVTGLNYVDGTNADNNAAVSKGCTLTGAALPATGATAASNAANAAAVAANPLAPQLPVGGFSDVEASLFPANIGGGDVSSKGTEGAANIGQVFGVVVSTPLYRAMQAAQGITPAQIAADTTFDPAIAPNITSAQYVSIIAAGGAYQADWSPIVGAAGVGKKVILARRVATSGTQASSNAFFLKNPCAGGQAASVTPAGVAESTPTFEVFEGSSTGNVKTRISTASTNAGADNFAIGVMSTENDWRTEPTSATSGYRFIKVDGVHPEAGDVANARVQAANGNYAFHMELKNFERAAPAKTAFEDAIIDQITSALAAPPTAASCAVFPRGLTLSPLGGSICTVGTQITKTTVLGNNCSPAQLTQ